MADGPRIPPRLLIAVLIAALALGRYACSSQENPITGQAQKVALTFDQEIAIGLQAAPQMAQQHGGAHPDASHQARVDRVGGALLAALDAEMSQRGGENPYRFEFHLLRDEKTINAFALPGGQVFVTWALYSQFETEGQLAGVLGHEIGHVIERHGAQRMAKSGLLEGLAGAAGVAGGSQDSARVAQQIAGLLQLKYGREDELESDGWGVRLTAAAGYDPRAMLGVMRILDRASAGGTPEMLSTHPKPANRIEYIEGLIEREFPEGLPRGLKP